MRHLNAAQVAALGWPAAISALRDALAGGLDPEAQPGRAGFAFGAGELLAMPATGVRARDGRPLGVVKLATVGPDEPTRGRPRVQAIAVLFDADTLAPLATLDGTALTNLRTPALSALGVDLVAPPDAARLLVFGAGPQAEHHVAALRAVRPLTWIGIVGRDPGRAAALVARLRALGMPAGQVGVDAVPDADLVACATTARVPLFDGRLLGARAVVAACGSHEPNAREVDSETVRRCGGAVVESVRVAGTEAGDVLAALADGAIRLDQLVPMADLVRGSARHRPRLVKTVGMGWEDLAVAAAVFDAVCTERS